MACDFITNIRNLLADNFWDGSGVMEEPAEKMKVSVNGNGVQSIVYSFDKSQKGVNLFPFFKAIKGARSMCDYVIFASLAGKFYLLLVELKKGDSQAGPQLRAGKSFATFIVETYNRVYKHKITPVIRMISVHNKKIIKKGTTRMKVVTYNAEGFAEFKGSEFLIQEFLK